jgi:hypothetical protein
MSFSAKITFTGIWGFVPDKAFDSNPTTVYVLAPDGEIDPSGPPRTGADGNSLSRHRSFLRVNAANVVGTSGVPSSLEAIWYLGYREFRFKPSVSQGIEIDDLSGLASLSDVAPLYSKVDPKAVTGQPPASKLGARFVITDGTLHSGKSQGPWAFPDILSKDIVRVDDLANEVILELSELDTFTILGKPLTGGDEVPLELTAPENGTIEVTIGNLCDQNPLEWPSLYDRKPDEDFRWYFELLSPQDYANLESLIDGIPLPYPYPRGKSNARGADCFPAAYPPLG